MKTELTIEESDKLIELGVDKKYAELKITHYEDKPTEIKRVFTLTDILAIIPKEIVADTILEKNDRCPLDMGWEPETQKWHLGYSLLPCAAGVGIAPELIDALYSLLVWCIEEEYVETKDKEK